MRLKNIGLVPSRSCFTSWGEVAMLALDGQLFSCGVTIRKWGRCFILSIIVAPHHFLLGWLKLNLNYYITLD